MLDPNDFVDADEAFPDDYHTDEIAYAWFTVVPGNEVDHATLVYKSEGVSFLGGDTGCDWAVKLYYGYRFNGQALPIGDDAAKHVLEKLAGSRDLESYDWAAQDWVHFE